MPSRHSRKAKAAVDNYYEKKQAVLPSKVKSTTNSTPAITVTDASPPEDILHSSWKFLYIYQFISLFRHHLNLPAISLSQLESLLLFRGDDPNDTIDRSTQPTDPISTDHANKASLSASSRESSVVEASPRSSKRQEHSLAKLIVPILVSLYDERKRRMINDNNYPQYIYSYLYNHSLEENIQDILGQYTNNRIPFSRLPLLDKISILQELVDSVFETGAALQWKNTLRPEDMRSFPVGRDNDGWSYWIFGNSRLYREMAMSPKKRETDYTFQLIATTQDEWETWMKKFSVKSTKPGERALALDLQEFGTSVVQKMEAQKAAKLREEAKVERAKMIDMLPRKRSRRIEVKSEEDEKRRQLEELEQAQWEYEEALREQERKAQEEELERDRQVMQIEEARLKEDVYRLMDRMMADARQTTHTPSETPSETTTDTKDDGEVHTVDRLKYLRTKLKKNSTYEEVIEKASGWATLLDNIYKVVATPLDVVSPKTDIPSKAEQDGDLIDIDGPWTLTADDVPAIPPPMPDSDLPTTTTTTVSTTTETSTMPPTATLVKPQKTKQLGVNGDILFPSFSKALNFTGTGTTSDLKDPLLKLILCTLVGQIRCHPTIADLEIQNTRKAGKKRKTGLGPAPMDFYAIHKKLLLGQYKSDMAADETVATTEDDPVPTAEENGAVTTTTDGSTVDKCVEGGQSAFEYWLKDMDRSLDKADLGSIDIKTFMYNMFSTVFSKLH